MTTSKDLGVPGEVFETLYDAFFTFPLKSNLQKKKCTGFHFKLETNLPIGTKSARKSV